MTVDLFRSSVSPLGTGMSSNSLRGAREDAQAVSVRAIAVRSSRPRMGGTSWRVSYRRRGAGAKLLAGLLLVALLAGCASTNVPPMGYQGKPFHPESDERALWSQAVKEEDKLAKTGKIYEDPMLEEYLESVAVKVMPPVVQQAGGPPIRVSVFRDPTLNAFAMPNGHVYVHTGLLARVENEAQLATILGHELTHVTNRHALKFERDSQNKQIGLTALGIAASIGVAVLAGHQAKKGNYIPAEVLRSTSNAFLGLGLQLAYLAAVTATAATSSARPTLSAWTGWSRRAMTRARRPGSSRSSSRTTA